jgi:hypothetical protein
MSGFFIFGGALFFIGIVSALTNLKNFARRRRVRAIPTSSISQSTGGLVEIKGYIVAGEKGLVEAPISERQVVWARVTVQQAHSSGGGDGAVPTTSWTTVLQEITGGPFFVDDGSGEVARILPSGANVILDAKSVAESGTFYDASPGFEAFLLSHDLSSKNFFGFNKTLSLREELLTPGDTLYALGPSRREPGPPASEGSDLAAPSQLVMYADPGAHGELILTNKSEKQLAARLTRQFVFGLACMGAGALLFAAGVLIRINTHQAQPGALAEQQAQSDLMALQQDGRFTGDLSSLTSDARSTGTDTAAVKSDAALGTGCPVVSIVKFDDGTVGIDADTVRVDLQTLTIDIGTAGQDVAALKTDLANLGASHRPATPGAASAIAAASRAVQQAVREANREIDQVNADVAQASSTVNRMATGSCPSDRPGRAPVPISHLPGK